MAITHGIKYEFTYNGIKYSFMDDRTAGNENNISESIPDPSTNLEVFWGVDASEMKSLLIVSTGALTVDTNQISTPDHSFSLVANRPIVWTPGIGLVNPFDVAGVLTDVTSIFVTNASGAAQTLTIKSVVDPTP
jgi:hypothetical protein